MPPQTQQTQNPSQNNASYDFFLKSEKPKKTLLQPGSTKGRIFIVVAGAILLVVVAAVVISALSGGGNKASLLKVAQDQNEIVRVSTEGSTQATATSTKQFAITAQLSVASAQTDLLKLLKTNGVTYGTKDLSGTKSANTDQQLTTAAAASLYDQTFDGVMKTALQGYSADLRSAFLATHSVTLRNLLNNDYKSAQLLLTQVADTPN